MRRKKTDPVLAAADGYWSPANYVGQGFHVYGAYSFDSTAGSLFQYPRDQVHDFTFQGTTVQIPDAMDGTEDARSDIAEAYGSTREEYQNKLAVSADVEVGIGAFSGSISSSFSSNYDNTTEYAFHKSTYHSSLCSLELRREADNLAPGFQAAIDALPDDLTDLQPFSDFFERFGTHYIWRVTYGGSLELCTAVKKSTLLTEHDISVSASAQYASICKVGVKVDSSDKYARFEENSTTRIRAAGGNQTLAAGLIGQPPQPSKETVDDYTAWVASIADDPSPTAFKLKGVWDLCGQKAGIVRQAWDEYGAIMHPKLAIVTERSASTAPIITLGRALAATNPFEPSIYGGWQVIVLDRYDVLSDCGVKFNKTYGFSTDRSARSISGTYDAMYDDVMDCVEASDAPRSSLLLVAVSYNLQMNWGPMGSFYDLLYSCGGSTENLKRVQPWNPGSENSAKIDYVLVGAFDSGVGAGLDFAGGWWSQISFMSMEYSAAFYRSRLKGPYTFSLIAAGPR